MNIPRRLWRLARHHVREGFERLSENPNSPRSDARRELNDYLNDPTRLATPPPPPPGSPSGTPGAKPHPYAFEYRILGAPVGSDLETVQRHWRRLVRETHPDRFAGDPEAQQQAAERFRRINDAYERLKAYLA